MTAEKALLEREGKFHAVFNIANIGVSITDKRGDRIYLSGQAVIVLKGEFRGT